MNRGIWYAIMIDTLSTSIHELLAGQCGVLQSNIN